MALPRRSLLVPLLALLVAAPPVLPASATTFLLDPHYAGWSFAGGSAAEALAQLADQGLLGSLSVRDGRLEGTHIHATFDGRGLHNWTVDGDPVLVDLAVALQDAVTVSQRPVVTVGPEWPGRLHLADGPHAALLVVAPSGPVAELPAGATLLERRGDRALFAVAGRPLLLAGENLTIDGLKARAGDLLAVRLDPSEIGAALALPPGLVAWLSPGPAASTAWLSPSRRAEVPLGSPPDLLLGPHGEGMRSARLEVGRIADPAQGPVVLRLNGSGPPVAVPIVSAEALAGVRGPAVNITSSHPPVLWLAYDAAESILLRFRLDLRPAQVVQWETLALSARSATLRALADEHALGRLTYWPQGQPQAAVTTPTAQPALQLDFPLLGLRPDTTYEYHLELTDFAGNKATTAVRAFATPPPPSIPPPVLLAVAPAEDATVAGPVREVRIAFANPVGTIDPAQHLRLYVDKKEVTRGLAMDGGNITYRPETALGPGAHTVAVALRNSEGGSVEREWRFTVATAATPGPGFPAVLSAGLVAGLVAAVMQRKR